jgi:hypothetical protein
MGQGGAHLPASSSLATLRPALSSTRRFAVSFVRAAA